MTEPTSPTADPHTAPERYVPSEIEGVWMQRWLDAGIFHAEVDGDLTPYSIVIPPPNVTGALHMGHALNGAIQDSLIRFKRMQGYNACWLPGTDHAGIATQNVVEKDLRTEGLTRHDLGREKFLERVQQWKEQYGSTIIGQFKGLGCSLDYRRERFTMDDGYARAVLHAFVQLYDKGYIYRDNYLVNWCGRCHTAISDLEVRQVELEDEMFEVDYPLADGSGHVTVATVRPETIVADVAVAVHPQDDRYGSLVGSSVRVPMTDREVPVIADEYVERDFGTGALKITPGHDPNDFEIGLCHGLEQLSAIDPDLRMNDLAGRFAGLDADAARAAMVEELDRLGLLRAREPYRHSVPHCDRCGTRIEPLISLQWFCNMEELAKPAIAAVDQGEVRFVPEGAANIFRTWMENLKPWCLSRQLWWGHQLPVWYCSGDGQHVHVSIDGPTGSCPECDAPNWTRDEDVLDTWFSSGLWDFATWGWPDASRDLEYFHPTSVLCTAREIINLWVARMMMMSYEFLGEKPFRDVYIHSVIQAPDGRRMSKSLGTGIDPLELIAEFGADATRYGLLNMSSTQDVRFNKGKIQEGRDLANKLWNASRLLTMFGDAEALHEQPTTEDLERVEDLWIWSRLHGVTLELTALLEGYEFALYTKTLYSFIFSELCDWYLEAAKPRLRGDEGEDSRKHVSSLLAAVLDNTLRLMHPVMPHVTEEIAERVWGKQEKFVATLPWPASEFDSELPVRFSEAEVAFSQVQALVSQLRSLRQAAGLAPGATLEASLDVHAPEGEIYAVSRQVVEVLTNARIGDGEAEGITLPLDGATLTLRSLDRELLAARLADDLRDAESEVARATGKLDNPKFVERAPVELVDDERLKIERHGERAMRLRQVLEQL